MQFACIIWSKMCNLETEKSCYHIITKYWDKFWMMHNHKTTTYFPVDVIPSPLGVVWSIGGCCNRKEREQQIQSEFSQSLISSGNVCNIKLKYTLLKQHLEIMLCSNFNYLSVLILFSKPGFNFEDSL